MRSFPHLPRRADKSFFDVNMAFSDVFLEKIEKKKWCFWVLHVFCTRLCQMVAGRPLVGQEYGISRTSLSQEDWLQKKNRSHSKRLLTQRLCMARLRQKIREERGVQKRLPFCKWSKAKQKIALERKREKTRLRTRRYRALKKRLER